jgi:hypothetical protein
MNFDFSKSMKDASDAELIKILTTDRSDYQEVAIVAAETEFARRNLAIEHVERLKSENAFRQKIKTAKANEPLDFHWKVIAVIFPVLFQFIISGLLKGDGYDRKARELTKWTFIGIATYIVLIILMVMSGG